MGISSGKKAVQQTPRNTQAVTEAIKHLEEKEEEKSEKESKSEDEEKVEKADSEATDKNSEKSSEKESDSGSLPNSNIILSQVKAKDLVNQHTIHGVTCHVNKGFSQDEMKEIKNNMAEKHNAMERAKQRNYEQRNNNYNRN